MSFWDRIKPAERPPSATAVELSEDKRVLALGWDDGKQTRVAARTLRQNCPCAECVEEWTGRRVLDMEKVPQSTHILQLAPVGNYALTFTFSDAHGTGIFQWTFLKELSEKFPA